MKTKRNRRSKGRPQPCVRRHTGSLLTRSKRRLSSPAKSEVEPTLENRVQPVVEAAPVPPAPTDSLRRASDSAFHLYVREIGETKLLTPQEEIELAKRIQKGDANAREHMIKANLRLVVKIARDYEGYGLPLLDL